MFLCDSAFRLYAWAPLPTNSQTSRNKQRNMRLWSWKN